MTVQEQLAYLEGREFDANTGVASGHGVFRMIVRAHDVYVSLRDAAQAKRSVQEHIVHHVRKLAAREVEPGFACPWDSAMAACLLLLRDAGDNELAAAAAKHVLRAPNTFWARREANDIMETFTGQVR